MLKCGYDGQKPKISMSALKAQAITKKDPELLLAASEGAKVNPETPRKGVTEEELVEVIAEFYSRTDISALDKRKQVLRRAIRPKYGDFSFEKFGHGTLSEFLERNGFEEVGHEKKLAKHRHLREYRLAQRSAHAI
jgi:hypothetical protein